jgi:tetratricopeptide (TPR) repeat protein
VQLAQSPFLNIFPDARVRQTLQLMGRSPDDRVTKEVAREICHRQGLKAFLAGSISNLGSNYVIALEAVGGQGGEEMAREQVEATSKEGVLKALSQAASKLREKLGESLQSIRKFDAPLEEATTSSLEALKAFSLGREQQTKGRFLEAIPLYKRAVELDPNFAGAYAGMAVQYINTSQPGLAAEYAEKAFVLRDRVSENEKLRIALFYYSSVTGELDKAIEVQELFKQSYPREHNGPGNLSTLFGTIGQFERAVAEASEALRLNPNAFPWHLNLAELFIRLNRLAEAREVIERAIGQKFDSIYLRASLYQIAVVNGDTSTMQQQLDWASGKPDEYQAPDWQTQTAAFAGQWRRSQDFSHRAVELATRSDAKEVAAQYKVEAALRGSVFGKCQQTKADTAQALTLERNTLSLTRGAMALALCGEVGQAQSLIDELTKRYPKDTLINSLWLPVIRAAVEMNRNNPTQAVQLLEAARRYEAAGEFWPQYLRGWPICG